MAPCHGAAGVVESGAGKDEVSRVGMMHRSEQAPLRHQLRVVSVTAGEPRPHHVLERFTALLCDACQLAHGGRLRQLLDSLAIAHHADTHVTA